MTAAALATPGAAVGKPATNTSTQIYLVQLAGEPLATYVGNVSGIPATKPAAGAKLDTKSWNYQAYRKHLQSQRTDAMRKAGVDAKKTLTEYGVAFNGFAANLTATEVTKLRGAPGVVNIFKNTMHTAQTVNTPKFLGLSSSGGVWNTQFGGQSHAGEGVIVGDLDTGFWPESPSFSALPEPRPDADTIAAKWQGECVAGDKAPVTCNNKVIGARWYNEAGAGDVNPDEYFSPRDRNGHGSHTASTAAGNPADANVAGFPLGQASGMAPAARVAVYKVLWDQGDGNASGGDIDIIKAIDDAVFDGVDVINYSIGDNNPAIGPEDVAFLHAAAAGVFISASAGNSGPAAGTVDNAMPWQTTVGASTHDVKYAKAATLGNGTSYEGVGISPPVPSSPLIDATSAPAAGFTAAQSALCVPGALDAAKVTGKVVLCQRGTNARVEKSAVVKAAGGVGMILWNPTANSLNAEIHSVPTVHVGTADGTAIKAYIASAGAGATAALAATVLKPQRAPGVTPFSSVGPSQTSAGDLIKPDIIAPGVDVVAAVPPHTNPAGSNYNLESGTSMSAPHITGIAALLKGKNPSWSPTAIRSAMMTTAYQTDNSGQPIERTGLSVPATPLEMGSGHVRPAGAFNPGLVYESGPLDWVQWICGTGVDLPLGDGSSACETVGSIDPSNLNYPSIAIGNLLGKQTVTRTVTNTTRQTSVYFAKLEAPPGVTVTVTPSVLTVLPGRSASYKVEFTRTPAAADKYVFGSLTWADLRGHSVRSPIAVQPKALEADSSVRLTGTSGSQSVQVKTGFAGVLRASAYGLVGPTGDQTAHLVGQSKNFDPTAPAAGPAVAKLTVNAPAGSKAMQFATLKSEYPVDTDLDLYVFQGGELVGSSAGATADETVSVAGSGPFDVYVVQYALAGGRSEQDVHVHTSAAGPTNAGNFTVSPASQPVSIGQSATVNVGWTGLTAGTRYVGVIEYSDASAVRGTTVVEVIA